MNMKLDIKFKGGPNSFVGRQENGSLDNMSNIVSLLVKFFEIYLFSSIVMSSRKM